MILQIWAEKKAGIPHFAAEAARATRWGVRGETQAITAGQLYDIEFGKVYSMAIEETKFFGQGTLSLKFEDAGSNRAYLDVAYDFPSRGLKTGWMRYPNPQNPALISLAPGSKTEIELGIQMGPDTIPIGKIIVEGRQFSIEFAENVITGVEEGLAPQASQVRVQSRQQGDILFIDVESAKAVRSAELFDIQGRGGRVLELHPASFGQNRAQYQVSGLASGLYLLAITTEDGRRAVSKVLVQ